MQSVAELKVSLLKLCMPPYDIPVLPVMMQDLRIGCYMQAPHHPRSLYHLELGSLLTLLREAFWGYILREHSKQFLLLSENKREKRLIYSIPRNYVIAVCEGLAPIRRMGGSVSWFDNGQTPGTQESLLLTLSCYHQAEERE